MSIEHSPARAGNSRMTSDRGVAEILGCCRATVWRRVADGTLPKPTKIGGLSRWEVADIWARIDAAKAARTEAA